MSPRAWLAACCAGVVLACGSGSSGNDMAAGGSAASTAGTNAAAGTQASAGTHAAAGTSTTSGGEATTGGAPVATSGGAAGGGVVEAGGASSVDSVPCDELGSFIASYKAAHSGNGGKDWDINGKTPAELAADPDAQRLMALCGENQRPVIPSLAWEYGGADHAWINPEQGALAYCVYTPVAPNSDNWAYDAGPDHVTADVYVVCPDQNPCAAETGADQVAACIGDPSNFEILVDTASFNDGADVGLRLSNASTTLMLSLPDNSKLLLHDDI